MWHQGVRFMVGFLSILKYTVKLICHQDESLCLSGLSVSVFSWVIWFTRALFSLSYLRPIMLKIHPIIFPGFSWNWKMQRKGVWRTMPSLLACKNKRTKNKISTILTQTPTILTPVTLLFYWKFLDTKSFPLWSPKFRRFHTWAQLSCHM